MYSSREIRKKNVSSLKLMEIIVAKEKCKNGKRKFLFKIIIFFLSLLINFISYYHLNILVFFSSLIRFFLLRLMIYVCISCVSYILSGVFFLHIKIYSIGLIFILSY